MFAGPVLSFPKAGSTSAFFVMSVCSHPTVMASNFDTTHCAPSQDNGKITILNVLHWL